MKAAMEEIERRQPTDLPRHMQKRERPRVPPPPPPLSSSSSSTIMDSMRSPQSTHQPLSARTLTVQKPPPSLMVGVLDDVLLYRSWVIHWMSRLYHFHRHELSAYAHDLVKFLRDEALSVFKSEFGYKVSIRHTDEFVAFEIREDRDAAVVSEQSNGSSNNDTSSNRGRGIAPQDLTRSGRGFTFTSATSSMRRPRAATDESKEEGCGDGRPVRERRGGFVLYFPASEEEGDLETERRRSLSSSMMQSQRRRKEPQYVVLLRGNDDLMRWACAWLQRRFQCVVSTQVVRISPANLKWLARNWVVDSLSKESKENNQEEPTGVDEERPSKPPLLLKYRNPDAKSLVRKYTLTVPWATLRRLCEQAKESLKVPNAIPEVITLTEELYFESLPMNMSSFELESFDMADVTVDQHGQIVHMTFLAHLHAQTEQRREHREVFIVAILRESAGDNVTPSPS
ncbi:Centromere subunit l, partial [Globisporangium splendens]